MGKVQQSNNQNVEGFRVVYMEPDKLGLHPDNPKIHTEEQLGALGQSLEEFGWLSAPIYNERTQRLVDGHARVKKAIDREEAHIPVRVIDVDEDVELRILAAFDRIGDLRGYNDASLAALLEKCKVGDELTVPGFTVDDLNDLLLKIGPPPILEPAATGLSEEAPVQPEAPSGPKEPNLSGIGEDAATPSAAVRMVQLFFDADQHAAWTKLIEEACSHADVETASEAVLIALDHFIQTTLEMESNP